MKTDSSQPFSVEDIKPRKMTRGRAPKHLQPKFRVYIDLDTLTGKEDGFVPILLKPFDDLESAVRAMADAMFHLTTHGHFDIPIKITRE